MKENKFKIGDRIFALNIGYKFPLTADFLVKGIFIKDEGIFYTEDSISWVPEKILFESRQDIYKFIMNKCERELESLAYIR